MRIVFVDDEETVRHQMLQWKGLQHGHTAIAVESVADAVDQNADMYIIDVSGICPGNWQLGFSFGPICTLMERHPGAEIVIGSCMSRNAVEDILDDVQERMGKRPHFFDQSRGFDGLEDLFDELGIAYSIRGESK